MTLLIIDIHTHTYPTSDDSSLLPDELIQEAIRIGLDGICITDHDGFWKPQDIEELSKRHGFLVLPGCEVTTEEGHLLVYGLDRYIFGMHRAAFVRDLVDDAGGAIVVAHPYRRDLRPSRTRATTQPIGRCWTERRPATPYSGCPTRWRSEMAGARRGRTPSPRTSPTGSEMRGTGASDAHRLDDLGTYATEFSRTVTSLDEFVAELLSGRFRPVGRESFRPAAAAPSADLRP